LITPFTTIDNGNRGAAHLRLTDNRSRKLAPLATPSTRGRPVINARHLVAACLVKLCGGNPCHNNGGSCKEVNLWWGYRAGI